MGADATFRPIDWARGTGSAQATYTVASMSHSGVGAIDRRAPGRKAVAAVLSGALAAADVAALLLLLPVPAVLTLAPLLIRDDRIDVGFARIDTPPEAWAAAAAGSLLLLAIAVGTVKVVRRQRGWIDRRLSPEPAPDEPEDRTAARFQRLTERETQVLELMSRGLTNGAIAQELFISEATVRKHVGRVFAKLDMDTANRDRRVTAALTFARHADRQAGPAR